MAVILYLIIVLFALYQACADEFSHDQAPQGSSLAHELPRSQIARSYSNGQASLWPNNVGASKPISPRRRAFMRSGREPLTEIKARQSGEKAWGGWQNTRYLFTFGDSYTSTGFDPNGIQPNPRNPLGNPAYPGATTSNGPNYVDFLTTAYNRSYIQTYNLAFGGATVDQALISSPFGPSVQSFRQQITETFLPKYSNHKAVPWTSSDTLFTFFFGINDVILSFESRNDSLNYALIKDYEGLVYQLYAAGARNFVFLNVPPIDRTPGRLRSDVFSNSALAAYIGNFNFRLGSLAYYLGRRHPDTNTFFLDTNWLFTRVMDDPAQFVETALYKNTTKACGAYNRGILTMNAFVPVCDVPVNQYLWLNDLHPTYPVHNLIAAEIVRLLEA